MLYIQKCSGYFLLLLLLNRFSRVRLCVTPETAAHQAPPSLGFSRQEYWSGLLFPSPMHESEKWKWSRSVVSDSSWPHGLQLLGFSVHGTFQARALEWVGITFYLVYKSFVRSLGILLIVPMKCHEISKIKWMTLNVNIYIHAHTHTHTRTYVRACVCVRACACHKAHLESMKIILNSNKWHSKLKVFKKMLR